MKHSQSWHDGYYAYLRDIPLHQNEYVPSEGIYDVEQWHEGWLQADRIVRGIDLGMDLGED